MCFHDNSFVHNCKKCCCLLGEMLRTHMCVSMNMYVKRRHSSFNTDFVSTDYKFRKDEIFRRMKVTTFVQLVRSFCCLVALFWSYPLSIVASSSVSILGFDNCQSFFFGHCPCTVHSTCQADTARPMPFGI